MKTPWLIALVAVVLGVGSTLAIYEQRVQEQPSCMVRSSFQHPAAHEDWAQLGVPLNGQFADQERMERLGDRNGI
jgi:hypothetical protein